MNKKKFKKILEKEKISFIEEDGWIIVNNGDDVDLYSLTSLPENVKFENGGNVYLRNKKSFIERFNVEKEGKYVYVYKRVSKDLKTQEGTNKETTWTIGKEITISNWNVEEECGEGKFHACPKPNWCSYFRFKKDDRFIKIKVHINDIHEFKNPNYPQKIAKRLCCKRSQCTVVNNQQKNIYRMFLKLLI